MIRSYLGDVEMIEMIASRLTKTQKAQILQSYKDGVSTTLLAEKYSCTNNTINRTVKTLLSDYEYKLLKEKRSRISNKKLKIFDNKTLKEKKEDLRPKNSFVSLKEKAKAKDDDLSIVFDEELCIPEVDKLVSIEFEDSDDFEEDLSSEKKYIKNKEVEKGHTKIDSNFQLIEPLVSSYDFDQVKNKSNFEILNFENLPESVYMIVDKKVELELHLISDLPEWSFLPQNELQRNAILLFADQRSAKRSCSRNQRVIKIPDTSIFKLSKSYLISKGITRLILQDSIIALDN
tara:strand:- start:984 stop:1853 length:870 start_codon:yes stop_codon:yes gene_type:complete